MTDKALCAANKALCVADKALCVADKALCVADKALCVANKALCAADKALSGGVRGLHPAPILAFGGLPALTVWMNTHGKVGQSLLPGQHGARRWTEQYGSRLVQVRYRYDPVSGLRHTTVELVVETSPWSPPLQPTALVRIGFEEEALRHRLRAAGAVWEPASRRWRVPLPLVRELELENRLDTPSPHP